MKNVVARINRLHWALVKYSTGKAIQIGKLLTEAKKKVGHGNWENWMQEQLEFSATSAKRYMKLYEYHHEMTEEESTKLVGMALSEAYKEMTSDVTKDRKEYLRKQDEERNNRREAFANRKHEYKNPPKGSYENEIIWGKFEEVMPEMIANGMKGKFDALICSPPYNNGKIYGNYEDSKEYSAYLEMLKQYIQLSYELLRKSGRLIINFDEMTRKGMAGDHHHMLEADIINMIREMGLEFYELDKIIWYKKNSGADWLTCWGSYCSPSSPKLRNKFETILVFSKQEHSLPALKGMKADITEEEFKEWTKNVWEIHPVNTMTPHPAAYVSELCNRLIKLYTWQGSLVGDFFCGSGTTCKSAQQLNRRHFGADQNANFAQYSRDRLDLSKEELKEKYAEFIGGKKTDKKHSSAKKKLSVSKLKKNTTLTKKDRKGGDHV